jgi:oxygen-independent coproporphyrinogen-3 oxidase
VRAILDDYLRRGTGGFRDVELGFELDGDEQRRRWLLKSLLRVDGADLAAYRRRFGTEVMADFPELARLAELGLVTVDRAGPPTARLTAGGLERSDAIGPWLASERVRSAMRGYEPR